MKRRLGRGVGTVLYRTVSSSRFHSMRKVAQPSRAQAEPSGSEPMDGKKWPHGSLEIRDDLL